MKVIALRSVIKYMNDLVVILYEKEYFGFKESAKKYVDDLLDDITTNLPAQLRKPAPKYFDKYGKDMYYAVFRKSKNTHWYVFFKINWEKGEEIYKIRYISNNHVIAQYL